jgi:peptidoglycan/xylan/chitin deacetylase (PgdA/CDA1 family)
VVALTFDAGRNADAVPSILATLRGNHVPATFFLTGNFVHAYPAAARAIAASGSPYLTMNEGLKLAAQSFGTNIGELSCCAG